MKDNKISKCLMITVLAGTMVFSAVMTGCGEESKNEINSGNTSTVSDTDEKIDTYTESENITVSDTESTGTVSDIVEVKGNSMNDTLKNGDHVKIEQYRDNAPQYGDIVYISEVGNYSEPLIKRIIATAGQRIEIDYENNEVKIDGKKLEENYVKGRTMEIMNKPAEFPQIIPEGYVFVMGDNREASLDSRSKIIGLVPIEKIVGKVVKVIS